LVKSFVRNFAVAPHGLTIKTVLSGRKIPSFTFKVGKKNEENGEEAAHKITDKSTHTIREMVGTRMAGYPGFSERSYTQHPFLFGKINAKMTEACQAPRYGNGCY